MGAEMAYHQHPFTICLNHSWQDICNDQFPTVAVGIDQLYMRFYTSSSSRVSFPSQSQGHRSICVSQITIWSITKVVVYQLEYGGSIKHIYIYISAFFFCHAFVQFIGCTTKIENCQFNMVLMMYNTEWSMLATNINGGSSAMNYQLRSLTILNQSCIINHPSMIHHYLMI